MSTAHARNAAGTVAATHKALARAHRRMRAMRRLDVASGRFRIVRPIAAGIEMNLGLGGAEGAENQRDCDE